MNLTKENVKKICGIILFTVVVLVIVQNYEKVGNAIGLLWGIIFPFVLGGIIALEAPKMFQFDASPSISDKSFII